MKTKVALPLMMIVLFVLIACSLPWGKSAAGKGDAVQTAAAATIQAMSTAAAQASAAQSKNTPTSKPTSADTAAPTSAPPQPTSTHTQPPTATPPPTSTVPPTPTPKPCNLAAFVKDVTVKDGTVLKPGEHFTKTWRLKNAGTCTWQNYSLVFDHGDAMGGAAAVPISASVAPGQAVDVSVDLVAPSDEGTYEGYWKIRDDKGVVFGLKGDRAFWVKIKVTAPTVTPTNTSAPTPTATPSPTLPPPAMLVLDLYAKAPQASWRNGQGAVLPFPGSNSDSRGFARYADQYLLEDGQHHTHVLETHPQWVDNGSITGTYPSVFVPANAHFKAKFGFIAAANGGCGVGNVVFEVWAFYNNHPARLYSKQKACNGHLYSVDILLTPMANRQVQFRLVVRANGSSAQDWAVWVDPHVSTP